MGSELSVKIDLTIQWANSKRALDELRHNFWRYVEEMLKVQDSGSWQVEYASWNDFLESEIGWKSSYWHYLSQAYKTRAGLPASTIVDSESHLREISKAPKEKHADVVKSAQTAAKKAGRKPKASDYKKAVEATREPGDEMDVPERMLKKKDPDLVRVKAIKTAEALMRAIDDWSLLCRNQKWHDYSIDFTKKVLAVLKVWKK